MAHRFIMQIKGRTEWVQCMLVCVFVCLCEWKTLLDLQETS